MKLDTIALIMAVLGGAVYLFFLLYAGAASVFPFGMVLFIVLACFLYLLVRILWQRTHNAEDDYYDRNVDQ